jgi:hypothetical protein
MREIYKSRLCFHIVKLENLSNINQLTIQRKKRKLLIQNQIGLRIRYHIRGASWPNGCDVGLSTSGTWVRIPAEARRGICEQDTLKSAARGSQNKQNCLRH